MDAGSVVGSTVGWSALIVVLVSAVLWQLSESLLCPLILNLVAKEKYSRATSDGKAEWASRFVGTLHAIIAFQGMFFALLDWYSSSAYDHMFGAHPGVVFYESVSCGYFLWDLVFVLRYYLPAKDRSNTGVADISALIHAVMCGTTYGLSLLQQSAMFWTGCHLLFEVSTPFLHLMWFFRSLDVDNALSETNNYLFLITFVIGRNVMGPLYALGYFFDLQAVGYSRIMTYSCFWACILIADGLNYFWLWKIYLKLQRMTKKKPSGAVQKSQ